jgi:hypothetical protein
MAEDLRDWLRRNGPSIEEAVKRLEEDKRPSLLVDDGRDRDNNSNNAILTAIYYLIFDIALAYAVLHWL